MVAEWEWEESYAGRGSDNARMIVCQRRCGEGGSRAAIPGAWSHDVALSDPTFEDFQIHNTSIENGISNTGLLIQLSVI